MKQQREKAEVCLALCRQAGRHTKRTTRETFVSDTMTSNCSFDDVDQIMRYLEPAIYIPIFVLGVILNTAALLVFCIFLRKWTESTIYMTNLALMDLLLLLLLPFKMHATNHHWPGQLRVLCSVLENLYFIGIYGGIYTIMCIAGDRWVAICHPFKAKQVRSPKAALGTCMGVWALVLVAISSTLSRIRDGEQKNFHCFHGFSKDNWSPVVIITLQVFGFLLPALAIVYCSMNTIWVLQQSGQHSPKSRACVKIIYSSLSAFLLPFTPSHLGIFLQFLVHQGFIQDCSSKTQISLFIQTAMCLSNITCCLDALCYYFIAREVRNAKTTFRISMTSQRRATFSTSEEGNETKEEPVLCEVADRKVRNSNTRGSEAGQRPMIWSNDRKLAAISVTSKSTGI